MGDGVVDFSLSIKNLAQTFVRILHSWFDLQSLVETVRRFLLVAHFKINISQAAIETSAIRIVAQQLNHVLVQNDAVLPDGRLSITHRP